MSAKQCKFTAHERLLQDVILRQAGDMPKAILEAVQNSIDAGATKVFIDLTANSVTISDDGRGFTSAHQIEQVFGVFGLPQTDEEANTKTFGYFRMGRGQLFAFGRNIWRSGEYEMIVDIRREGLNYTLRQGLPEQKGCKVTVEFYDTTRVYESWLVSSLRDMVRYVEVDVRVNNQRLSADMSKIKWTAVTDDAYILLTPYDDLAVYNRGVFVRFYGYRDLDCGGVIVSRKTMKLNFARNDIMYDCPVWGKIQKHIEPLAAALDLNFDLMDNEEKLKLLEEMTENPDKWKGQNLDWPIIPIVHGKWVSVRKLSQLIQQRAGKVTISGPFNSVQAERVHDYRLACVLAAHVPESRLEAISAVLSRRFGRKVDHVPFERVAKTVNMAMVTVPRKIWTKHEKDWVRQVTKMVSEYHKAGLWLRHECAAYPFKNLRRQLLVGESDKAKAWTDGHSFIAVDRSFIRHHPVLGDNIFGINEICCVLEHELAHTIDEADTMKHTPEHQERQLALGRARGAVMQYCMKTHERHVKKKLQAQVCGKEMNERVHPQPQPAGHTA